MSAEAGHIGVVAALEGDLALIRFARTNMCGGCHACVSFSDQEMETRVKNTLGAKVGDRVQVTLEGGRVVQAAWLAYGIPLALLIIGVALGSLISDWAAAGIGLGSCALAYLILHSVEGKLKQSGSFRPRMERMIEEEETKHG